MNSRLISSPTTKKKIVRSPWLTQWSSECANVARAPLESQRRFPPRRERRAEGRVAEHQREQRRQPQEQSRRRPPANELERGGLDAMAERAEHRVGQRAFIPGARIAAAVDEESRRHPHAAAPRALDVLAHPRLRRRECGLVRRVARRQVEVPRDLPEVAFRERRPPLHQRLVNLPEPSGRFGRVLRQLGGAGRVLAAGDGQVPKHVPHPLAEPAPQPLDDLVNRVTVRARIAAVLDQRHLRIGRPQNVVAFQVHGTGRVDPALRTCSPRCHERPPCLGK